jgi:dTDP-4-dehydrorhamnose 3,5-epimerase
MKLIDGVKVIESKRNIDERGWLQEIFRNSLVEKPVQQVYITNAEKNVIKSTHQHIGQIDFMTCLKGKMKLILVDSRHDSPTFGMINTFILENMNKSVLIPEKVLHGFQGLREGENTILNCVSSEYNHENPDEIRYPTHGYFVINNKTNEIKCIQQKVLEHNLDLKKYSIIEVPASLWEIQNG